MCCLFPEWVQVRGPLMVLILILTTFYASFLVAYLPGYIKGTSKDKSPHDVFEVVMHDVVHHTIVLFVMTGIFVMAFANFLLCHFSDPGGVPKTRPWTPGSQVAFPEERGYERKKTGLHRYCRVCNLYKPDRSHHCRFCKRCVAEMDHHCPWINNCVGFRNHKYFFLLLLYGSAGLIMWGIVLMDRVVLAAHNVLTVVDVVVITLFVFDTALAPVVTAFFFFHCFLLYKGVTTIEFCEKLRSKDKKKTSMWQVLPYNRGLYGNICHLLGPCPLFWLLPVRWGMDNEGTHIQPSEAGKKRLMQEWAESES